MFDLQFIQTSPEVILLLAKENKEIHLLDPKTMSILYKYTDDAFITKPIAYSTEYEQFLSSQSVKTLINIWNTDAQAPCTKISLPEKISFLEFQQTQSIMIGGTENGTIFIWEIPSGFLLKKYTGHNKKIISIGINQNFLIHTATETEIKIWKLMNIFGNKDNNNDVKHSLVLNTKERIIDVISFTPKIFILSEKSIAIHKISNLQKQESIQLEPNSTCFTSNSHQTHLYVGNKNRNIYQYRINKGYQYREINYTNQNLQFNKTPKERILTGHKYPVTCIKYIDSLSYLISGSEEGEIIIWLNGQIKKQMKLFRTEILQIKIIQRPSNFKGKKNRNEKTKIKGLHKYEQSKENEPLQFVSKEEIHIEQENEAQIFKNIIEQTFDKKALLHNQIETLRNENNNLIKCNEHYSQLFLSKFD